MEQRVNIAEAMPEAYKAMYHLSTVLNKTDIAPIQKHLLKIRASQINGCAFCIDMHTKEALKDGESTQRIFLLNAWRETDLFTEEEKVILALTEEVTLIHQHGVSHDVYERAVSFFGEATVAHIIMSAVLINAWNRIAVSTHLPIAG